MLVTSWNREYTPDSILFDGETGERIRVGLVRIGLTTMTARGEVAGAFRYQSIARYDADTFERIGALSGAPGGVDTVNVSADGRILSTYSLDNTVTLYDLVGGVQLGDSIHVWGEWNYPQGLVYSGVLRADSEELAVNVPAGIAVWDLRPSSHADAACAMAGRDLTRDEWLSYLGDLVCTGRRAGSGRPGPSPPASGFEVAAATPLARGRSTQVRYPPRARPRPPRAATRPRRPAAGGRDRGAHDPRIRDVESGLSAARAAGSTTGRAGPRREVHGVDAGGREHRDVAHAHASARHELDGSVQLAHHALQCVATGAAVDGTARGQHPAHVRAGERGHRRERVGRGIHCSVHGDVEVLGRVDERTDGLEVELARIGQRAHHHAVGAERPDHPDVAEYRLELVGVVDEASCARTHEHVHESGRGCRAHCLDRRLDESRRWGESAEAKGLAELDPRRPGFKREAGPCGILDGDLDGEECWHSVTLSARARRRGAGRRRRPAPLWMG